MSTTTPCIKGSAFGSLAEDVKKLLDSGSLPDAQVRRWLRDEDLRVLEEPVVVSRWYDIGCYSRLTELMRDVEGGGHPEYVVERGRRAAERLLEAGLYAQMEYLQRTEAMQRQDARERFEAFGRDLRRLTTLSAAMFNFSRWSARPDPETGDRYLIEVTEAQDFPEVLCWSTQGFINGMSSLRQSPAWRWRRAANDHVVFQQTRAL